MKAEDIEPQPIEQPFIRLDLSRREFDVLYGALFDTALSGSPTWKALHQIALDRGIDAHQARHRARTDHHEIHQGGSK